MADCIYALEELSTVLVAIRYYALRRYITRAFARHGRIVNIVQDVE
jgi:hypothetical protein